MGMTFWLMEWIAYRNFYPVGSMHGARVWVYISPMETTPLHSTVQSTFSVAVVMERVAITNRWQSYKWQVAGVIADRDSQSGVARTIVRHHDNLQRIYPGFELSLHRDEAEGYYLNLTSGEPRIYVMWRLDENRTGAEDEVQPQMATLSYNEAARLMDAQEKVDSVALLPELLPWLESFVQEHYKPEVKKPRIRPQSFASKEGRYKSGM